MIRDHFFNLVAELGDRCRSAEQVHCYFTGERSDFVRFNEGRVRQAGEVTQHAMQIALVQGKRHTLASCELSGDFGHDLQLGTAILAELRRQLPDCPEDPFLNYSTDAASSDSQAVDRLPPVAAAVNDIIQAAGGLDLVGHYAAGEIRRGFANSRGQRRWHSRAVFNFDWSVHDGDGRASKQHYTGSDWQRDVLMDYIEAQRHELALLRRPRQSLRPGPCRAYLAPAALAELMGLLGMNGFSMRMLRSGQSPLLKLAAGERRLSEHVHLSENRAGGLAPCFSAQGFTLPDRVSLISAGRSDESLADARSALEYGVRVNAGVETPQALEMAPGTLASADILAALDTGLYINHLWYGNFSDTNHCRITGMTRYACFRVDNGVMRAPVDAMRFDDSLYHLLGDALEHITAGRRFLHDPDTYDRRSLRSLHLPGILCNRLLLTL